MPMANPAENILIKRAGGLVGWHGKEWHRLDQLAGGQGMHGILPTPLFRISIPLADVFRRASMQSWYFLLSLESLNSSQPPADDNEF